MVDAALRILPDWQRGMVTRPESLILVNQVMRARPTHHMIVAEAPKWALREWTKDAGHFSGRDRRRSVLVSVLSLGRECADRSISEG